MFTHVPRGLTVALFGCGALGVAATTAIEVLTAPYSSSVSLYQLNGVVHMVKVLALVAFLTGLLGVLAHWGDRLGRVGRGAGLAMAVATVMGSVPYTLIESSLDPALTPAAANARLEAIYADHVWVGIIASVAMPIIVLSVLTLAVVVIRRRLLPIWAPVSNLLSIPVAIAVLAVSESTGVELPHPPAWIFLGLAMYGAALGVSARAFEGPRTAPTGGRRTTSTSRSSF